MNKKTFLKPELEIQKMSQADVIATSTQQDFTIKEGEGYQTFEW